MSLHFKNKNHLPVTPKSWGAVVHGKYEKVNWHSSVPWESFYSQVVAFAERNNIPVPSMGEVENHVCIQMASHWCTGDNSYRPAPAQRSGGGCAACGKRR